MNENFHKATKLFLQHLSTREWTIRINKRLTSVWGRCSYTRRTIELSQRLVDHYSWDEVRNTLLHEIAHALVGAGNGHNAVWRRKCLEIGGDGKRCSSKTIDRTVSKKYGIIRDKEREIQCCTPETRLYKNLVKGKWDLKNLQFPRRYGTIDRESLEFIICNNT